MTTNTLTDRQKKAWPEAIERLRESGAIVPGSMAEWTVDYSDEVRPGRGRAINAQFIDGEVYAQILMDVYGYPNASFATLDWVHADSDEECDCGPCETEREAQA
jgi:hypothetical protein